MSMTVSLSKEIYPEWAIARAAADYAALAAITLEAGEERITCTFSQCKYGEERTSKEFLNYLINLLNSIGRI